MSLLSERKSRSRGEKGHSVTTTTLKYAEVISLLASGLDLGLGASRRGNRWTVWEFTRVEVACYRTLGYLAFYDSTIISMF